MKLVIIESPYAGDTEEEIKENVLYARLCIKDSLGRGEAPIASHLLYTQEGILDDAIPEQRRQGINAGLAWLIHADISAVYTDRGITKGMEKGINSAEFRQVCIEFRTLYDEPNPILS
jgi:hypothetical protein